MVAELTLLLAVSVCVPPAKFNDAVPVAVRLPLMVPPPDKLNRPVFTSTVPELLSGIAMASVPVPAVLLKVPELINVDIVPPKSLAIASFACASKVPVLLMSAPEPVRIRPPVHVAVPSMFSVRTVISFTPVPLIVSAAPAPMFVAPVPVIVPSVQLTVPVRSSVPAPASVPPLKLNEPLIKEAFAMLRDPPERVKDPALFN